MICYYNAKYLEQDNIFIPVEISGFQYGYGVFTSLRTNQGKALLLSEHIKRLKESCNAIGIAFPSC